MKCVDCKHRHFCAEKAQILGQVFDPNYDGEHGCLDFSVLTNADRIRAMSDEELARMLNDGCPPDIKCSFPEEGCEQCWIDWLKQPVKDGEGE